MNFEQPTTWPYEIKPWMNDTWQDLSVNRPWLKPMAVYKWYNT